MSCPISIGRVAAVSGILLLWAVMTGWLLRNEAFPQRFGKSAAGYRVLLAEAPVEEDTWMRVVFRDRTIGYARRRLETREHDPAVHQLIHYELFVKTAILGQPQEVRATAEAALDAWQQLQRFTLHVRAGTLVLRADGQRSGASRFDVEWTGTAGPSRMQVDIPDDTVLFSPLQQMLVKRLAPGETLRLRSIDPFSVKPADWRVEAVAWEPVTVDGRTTNALALRVTSGVISLRAWMDAEGRILREESPLGWTLEACEASQVLAWVGAREAAVPEEIAREWGGLFERLRPAAPARE